MATKTIKTVDSMVAEANEQVRILSIEDAKALIGSDEVTFIDVRDVREIAKTGRIPGARHVPRGMLEFWIDPASPYYKDFFGEDKTFVFYCAGYGADTRRPSRGRLGRMAEGGWPRRDEGLNRKRPGKSPAVLLWSVRVGIRQSGPRRGTS